MTAAPRLTAGVHLPQAGPAASGEAMTRAAVLAEELGFADVWVSDHLVVPSGAEYPPSAYVFEPFTALALDDYLQSVEALAELFLRADVELAPTNG